MGGLMVEPQRSSAPAPQSSASPPMSRSFDACGDNSNGDPTWLTLHRWMLILTSEDGKPYSFVSLRRVQIKESDPAARKIVLASTSWPNTEVGEEWLCLCLLLSDGRFQAMEAPELEIFFAKQAEFDQWKQHLSLVCSREHMLRLPGLH